jgi:predicted DNA-binding protein (UPF0251 family)
MPSPSAAPDVADGTTAHDTRTASPERGAAEPKRINVAVTPETVQALRLVMDNEQVNLTEAARRLMSYGEFVYRAIKEDGQDVLLRAGDTTREVVLLR